MTKIYQINRRKFIQYSSLAFGISILDACTTNKSQAPLDRTGELDKIIFGTNWYAEAEHGGFYQAVATGIYQDHGLDVTIKMGGAQVNSTQLLMGKAVDFFLGHSAEAIKAVEEGIPKITVAAIFQKDPQILLAHPNMENDTLEVLKGKPIFVSSAANTTYWPLLKTKYGFTDDQKRPYNFNVGPFLADRNALQQGILTSEPFSIKQEAGFEPVVILLAEHGYTPYAFTIETRKELVETDSDLVQRFVDASIKGWYSYLENPAPGNELIKKDNPEMTDELIAYSLEQMEEYGIIISGDAETKGIGAMTDERWQSFFSLMVEAGVYDQGTKYKDSYTLDFVNKGVNYYKS